MGRRYVKTRRKVKAQLRNCRDPEIRVKAELILLGLKLGNVSEACARRGFSRKFYYTWYNRLRKAGYNIRGLKAKSTRPKTSPNKICKKKEKAIRWYARRGYGARMIKAMLSREGTEVSKSTICHVLNNRNKPIKKRKNKLKKHRKRYELAIPGQRLQMDVKYAPQPVAGKQAYVYVAVDECTRWRFAKAYPELNEQMTIDFLDELRMKVPFNVQCIQTDNGPEFTFNRIPGNQREHHMDTWCRKYDIRHRLIPPGEKELNGKVERSHRIDEQYFYWKADTRSLDKFNQSLKKWLKQYNEQRPHGGLDYKTPKEKLESLGLKLLEQKPNKLSKLEQYLAVINQNNAA